MSIKNQFKNDVTVIIRSFKERSIEICLNSVLTEIDQENVFLIQETPFAKAVQKTFEIGISENKKWTLAIDADLILLPNSISTMLNQAKAYDNLYVYQGHILDKFRCGVRQGGPHLYKTENLEIAIELIKSDQANLRPESAIYDLMKKRNHNVVIDKKIYALHDFEQFYKDIYRKAYFHGIKHKGWKSLLPLWLEKCYLDFDYKIASVGFLDGYFSEKYQYPSPEEFDERYIDLLNDRFKIKEKAILNSINKSYIENVLNDYNVNYNKTLDIIYRKKPIFNRIKSKLFR